MQVTIIPFGRIAEIAGSNHFIADDIEDTEALKSFLEETYPAMKTTKYALAVNKQLATKKTRLSDNDTVAILPPFSGG